MLGGLPAPNYLSLEYFLVAISKQNHRNFSDALTATANLIEVELNLWIQVRINNDIFDSIVRTYFDFSTGKVVHKHAVSESFRRVFVADFVQSR
jgi:hypothetical protein